MLEVYTRDLPIYFFWKRLDGRYVDCNEKFAHVAGLKNPGEIVGKRDEDLIWKVHAEVCRIGDERVLSGKPYKNQPELLVGVDGIKNVLVTKVIKLNPQGNPAGIVGMLVEAEHSTVGTRRELFRIDPNNNLVIWYQGEQIILTQEEVATLQLHLARFSNLQAARMLGVSSRTVEERLKRIAKRLRCSSVRWMAWELIQSGLVYIFLDLKKWTASQIDRGVLNI